MSEKPRISTATKILIAVMITIAVVVAQFFFLPWFGFGQAGEMVMLGTGVEITYDFDAGAAFHSNDSRHFFFVTREGISYKSSGSPLFEWHETFSFNNPWLVARGDFIAVGEVGGGRVIYVYSTTEQEYRVVFEYPVISFSINESGILSAIVRYDRGYGVYVFNRHRSTVENPLYHWPVFDNLHQPTHAEVSADGTYIAIAIRNVTVGVNSTISFRYINQWDAWGTDQGIFGAQDFPGQLVTAMQFMNNNRLIVATTSQITGFQLGPGHATHRPLWTHEKENTLTHVEFYNGTHFAIAAGERRTMAMGEGDPIGMVRIYGTNGVETGSFDLGRRVTHMRMGHNSVIVGGDRSFHAIDFRGNPVWSFTSAFDARDFLFLDDINTILIAGSNRAEVFRRQRQRTYEINEDEGEIFP
ncbi:MAG: DUF5711 family protein [Defluviitaleaceae bacterium]|nr:DUF5711 family protein [Defluviitaleaceae bacterium]